MDNDKKTIIDCIQTIKTNDLQGSSIEDAADDRTKRKRRLIIVSVMILTVFLCILAAAIILFGLWTTRIRLQETTHRTIGDKEVDQELYQDTVDSLTYYHVSDSSMEIWVILDYNRELEIMKVRSGASSTTCYVSPRDSYKTRERNETTGQLQATTSAPSNTQRKNESLSVVTLRPSTRPIREKSILGRRGQELCQHTEAYWILSSCNPPGGDSSSPPTNDVRGGSRRRRASYSYYGCFWDWTRCGYVNFADTPYSLYYACDWACGWYSTEY